MICTSTLAKSGNCSTCHGIKFAGPNFAFGSDRKTQCRSGNRPSDAIFACKQ